MLLFEIQNTIRYLYWYFQMFGFDILLPLPSKIMCVWYKTQVKCEKSEPRSVKSSQNYVWQMIVFNAYYSLCTTYLLFLYFKSYLYLYLFIKAIVPARGEGACANLCFHFFVFVFVIVFVFVDQGNCVGTRERGLVWRRSVNQRCLDCRSTLFHQYGFLYFPSYLYF